jgi:glucosyl-3-phosphoglycerate synthase
VPFVSGYGVEVGLLVDLLQECGLGGLAQVDLGTRRHSHQTDEALGRMAGQIVSTVLGRAGRGRRLEPGGLLTQFAHDGAGFVPVSSTVAVDQRPPLCAVPEYASLRAGVVG